MAIRDDFTAGEVLAAADLNDTFGAKLNLAGGKVLQVVSTTKTDTFTMSSSTFAEVTGLTATITPSATSSKILIICQLSAVGASNRESMARLIRGATPIAVGDSAGSRIQATADIAGQNYGADLGDGAVRTSVLSTLDSPNTASAIVYGIEVRAGTNISSNTVYVNRSAVNSDSVRFSRTISSITLMEISA
jgi:hypothetical protein